MVCVIRESLRASWTTFGFSPCSSMRVAKVVGTGAFGEADLAHDELEVAADQVIPVHRPAGLGGENEVLVPPETRVAEPLPGLALAVGL